MNLTLALSFCQMFLFSGPAPELVKCSVDHSSETSSYHETYLINRAASDTDLNSQLQAYRKKQSDPDANMALGVTYMSLANASNWGYLDQAISHFDKASKGYGNDPLLLMFRGRAIGAKALNTKASTLKRLGWAREGFKLMDKATGRDSNCFLLRLMRGEAQLMAHPILRRSTRLDEDAIWLKRFTNSNKYKELPDFQKARLELFLGNYLEKRKKDASDMRRHWERAITLSTVSPWADEARARLTGSFRSLGYDGEEG